MKEIEEQAEPTDIENKFEDIPGKTSLRFWSRTRSAVGLPNSTASDNRDQVPIHTLI